MITTLREINRTVKKMITTLREMNRTVQKMITTRSLPKILQFVLKYEVGKLKKLFLS